MAEWHVNANAATSGSGTSKATAFRRLAEAVAAARGGDTIRVAGGVYRETLSLSGLSGASSGSRTRILGDPDDWFVVTGGEPLPDLVPCVSADSVHVGDIWRSVRKTTVPASLFPGNDPQAGNLCLDGKQMPICAERADTSDSFFLTYPGAYHQADSITTSGSNITGFKKPSVTDGYTQEQVQNSQCNFVHGSNRAGTSSVTFNTSAKVIELNSPQAYAGAGNPYANYFALFNLLPAMKTGEWGYRKVGTDVVIYVRATGAVEYSARSKGVDLSGASHVEMANFKVAQVSCPNTSDAPLLIQNGFGKRDDILLHDFEINESHAINGYAPLYASGVNDLHAHHFKITRAQNMYGMFFQGSGASNADWPRLTMTANVSLSSGTVVTGASSGQTGTVRFTEGSNIYLERSASGKAFVNGETLRAGGSSIGTIKDKSKISNKGRADLVNHDLRGNIHDFEISYVSSAAFRMFTVRDMAIYNGIVQKAAKQSHGNTINFYQGSHNCLVWGLNGQDSDGFYTWQESDSLVFAFCAASASNAPNGGARAIYAQQNRYSEHPGNVHGWLGSCVLNTRGIPVPSRVMSTTLGNGLDVSSYYAALDRWRVWNNIHHGSSSEGGGSPLAAWDHNINTKGSGTGAALRGPNDILVDPLTFYNDPVNGDFGYPANSPVRTFAAKDWSDLIDGFRARWPQVAADAFTRDMTGAAIDWSRPPVGPTVDPDADYRAAPVAGEPTVPQPPPPPPPPPPETPVRPVVRSRVLRLSVMAA